MGPLSQIYTHAHKHTHYCVATCHECIAAPRNTQKDAHTTCVISCLHEVEPMRFSSVSAKIHADISGQPQIAKPHQPGLHVMKSRPCSTALLKYTIAYACKHQTHGRSINGHLEDCRTAHVPANHTQLSRTLYTVARTNPEHSDVARAAPCRCWPTSALCDLGALPSPDNTREKPFRAKSSMRDGISRRKPQLQ